MGYASYLEDIMRELDSNFTLYFESKRKNTTAFDVNEMKKIIRRTVSQTFDRYVELLTDDNLDIAKEIVSLRKSNKLILKQMRWLQHQNSKLETQLNELKSLADELRRSLDEANKMLEDRRYFVHHIDKYFDSK